MKSERETKQKTIWISNLDLKIQKLILPMKSVAMKKQKQNTLITYAPSHFWYLRKNKQKRINHEISLKVSYHFALTLKTK